MLLMLLRKVVFFLYLPFSHLICIHVCFSTAAYFFFCFMYLWKWRLFGQTWNLMLQAIQANFRSKDNKQLNIFFTFSLRSPFLSISCSLFVLFQKIRIKYIFKHTKNTTMVQKSNSKIFLSYVFTWIAFCHRILIYWDMFWKVKK